LTLLTQHLDHIAHTAFFDGFRKFYVTVRVRVIAYSIHHIADSAFLKQGMTHHRVINK